MTVFRVFHPTFFFLSLVNHNMSQTPKNREETILSALDDLNDEVYLDVTKIVNAYDVKPRTLQRRVQRKNSYYTRSITNRALNLAQKQMLFEYIERLNRVGMSSTSEMLRSSANYILRLDDLVANRCVELN